MLYPKFHEKAQMGKLTIGANTLDRDAKVEIVIEDAGNRLELELDITHHDLMRALMGRGAVPIRFVNVAALSPEQGQ